MSLKQYYGYYGGYGDDTAPADDTAAPVYDEYYGEEMVEEETCGNKPMMLVFGYLPVALDLAQYYIVNDKKSGVSDWDTVANLNLYSAIARGVVFAAGMFVPPVKMVAGLLAFATPIGEVADLYLINTAESSSTFDKTNTLYAMSAVNIVLSAYKAKLVMDYKKCDSEEEVYYEEYYEEAAPAEEEEGGDSGYGGYGYGYY